MDKKNLSEQDIRTKFITPAIVAAGWDLQRQIREEVTFTKGRIIVRGKLHARGEARRADYVLYHQDNRPIAVIEAKDNKHEPGDGMQQALDYAEALDVPFAFARDYFAGASKQTTNLASINMTQLRSCAFPVPPLAEQRRIVAKVTELLTLCDPLEARIATVRAMHAQLAEALLAQVVAS